MAQITVTSSSRFFPDEPSSPHTFALSILDASVSNFAPTASAWVYNTPVEQNLSLDIAHLQKSFVKTLNVYPQWAGQLQYTKYNATGGHTSRSRRLEVIYGTSEDPGVEFVVANGSATVTSSFPSFEDRTSGLAAFDASSLGELDLLPKIPALAPRTNGDSNGLPCLIVQVTAFKCGGVVIALKVSHPLADAQTLALFVHDWAAINSALARNVLPPILARPFCPADLDRAALGDIDATAPDPEIIETAQELPIHRYDWWASADGCPFGALESTNIPPHLTSLGDIELGPPIPWAEWDVEAPVSNFLLYFSVDEIARIWAAASSPGQIISRFDALQAHLWSVLIRAQEPESEEEQFHFNLSLGARDRVAPALGEHFLGSPIVLARATGTRAMSLPQLARTIRGTLAQFTHTRVAALLHEMAFDVDARRMWGAFVGRRNTIITSWLRLGVYEIMEGMPQSTAGGPWYLDGASVSLMLTTRVIQRMLRDPLLRKYRSE
ncbi:transferase family-domain-containing protein [Mycena pura]|uniref:Transferase family-domain-containing protein n=1 Tax=Mycena pura TaxID=153505 RepID=A0AAD7E443_9AGAR|nr:transferase family-domain-containing protein [Mycena pura]